MAETTILELRQKNSSDIERNGIYKVTLDSAIQIEEVPAEELRRKGEIILYGG